MRRILLDSYNRQWAVYSVTATTYLSELKFTVVYFGLHGLPRLHRDLNVWYIIRTDHQESQPEIWTCIKRHPWRLCNISSVAFELGKTLIRIKNKISNEYFIFSFNQELCRLNRGRTANISPTHSTHTRPILWWSFVDNIDHCSIPYEVFILRQTRQNVNLTMTRVNIQNPYFQLSPVSEESLCRIFVQYLVLVIQVHT